jgi:hypothetical protein
MGGEGVEHARRLLDRSAFGQIDDDLQLRLVVERQHLEDHELHGNETHRDRDRQRNAAVELMAVAATRRTGEEPAEEAAKQRLQRRLALVASRPVLREQPLGEPRRDDESDSER